MNKQNLLDLLASHKEALQKLSNLSDEAFIWDDALQETDLLIERTENSYKEEEQWKDKLINLMEGLEIEPEKIEEAIEYWESEDYKIFGIVFVITILTALEADPEVIEERRKLLNYGEEE